MRFTMNVYFMQEVFPFKCLKTTAKNKLGDIHNAISLQITKTYLSHSEWQAVTKLYEKKIKRLKHN